MNDRSLFINSESDTIAQRLANSEPCAGMLACSGIRRAIISGMQAVRDPERQEKKTEIRITMCELKFVMIRLF